MAKQLGCAAALRCLSRTPRPPFARDRDLPLSKPVRSAMLAT
jgi:hypothetical protein